MSFPRLSNQVTLTRISGIAEFNIHKVNLELLFSLDTNQERRTTTSSNNLIGEVRALEDESKRTFKFLAYLLGKGCKGSSGILLGVIDVLCKFGDNFSV